MRNRFTMTQEQAIKTYTSNLIDFCKNRHNDILIIRGTSKKEKATLTVFKGKSAKPIANYYYPTYERREEAIVSYEQMSDARLKDKEERKAAKKSAGAPKSEIGQIFVESGGYEQTNVSYYQLVKKASAHYGIFKEISQEQVEGSHGHDCCRVLAVKDDFIGNEFKAKITRNPNGSEYIRINSYSRASVWDGSSNYKSWYH